MSGLDVDGIFVRIPRRPQSRPRAYRGRGADVALNAVGAPVFAQLAESLGIAGRMVVFSAAGGREVQLDLFMLYRRRLQLLGLDTAQLDLAQIAKLFEKFGPYLNHAR